MAKTPGKSTQPQHDMAWLLFMTSQTCPRGLLLWARSYEVSSYAVIQIAIIYEVVCPFTLE
jgi:hypothetical protein